MMVDGEYKHELGGIRHWVRVAGAAHGRTPLVLVHGGPGGNAYAYETIGDRLAQQHTVVFYDQRGCGRSETPADPASYTPRQLVDDLEALRVNLGVEYIIPWGVSYGALIAAEYAVAHPNAVERLILQAPPIVGPLHPGPWTTWVASADTITGPATRAAMREAVSGINDPIPRVWAAFEALSEDSRALTRFQYHDPAKAAVTDAADRPSNGFNEQMARALIGQERPDLADDLAELTIPTLIMIGLWDRNAGVDASRDLAVRMPHSTLHLFMHSAHLPHEEEPDTYINAIQTFIDLPVSTG